MYNNAISTGYPLGLPYSLLSFVFQNPVVQCDPVISRSPSSVATPSPSPESTSSVPVQNSTLPDWPAEDIVGNWTPPANWTTVAPPSGLCSARSVGVVPLVIFLGILLLVLLLLWVVRRWTQRTALSPAPVTPFRPVGSTPRHSYSRKPLRSPPPAPPTTPIRNVTGHPPPSIFRISGLTVPVKLELDDSSDFFQTPPGSPQRCRETIM